MSAGRWASKLLLPGALLALGCHAIEEQLPTQPSASPGAVLSPIAIPVILPRPAPTPTPTPKPNPNPTPTPTPAPAPPPGGGSCHLPASNPANPRCTDESALLYGAVDTALTRATQNRPDFFDFNNKKCENCYFVKNVSGYVAEVQRLLSAQGVCSYYDGEELAVKKTNDYSEQYDILLASGHMRRGVGSYRGICRPSWF
jgi:hypothetical protein